MLVNRVAVFARPSLAAWNPGRLSPALPQALATELQAAILADVLDAARSINRRDYEPERESRSGLDATRPSPAELPGSLLRENDRLRFDLLKADADRYPAQYRAFIERYLQRLNGSPR